MSDFIASFRCWVISSFGQRNALSGTVTVADSTPVAKPGTGVPAVAGVTAIVPCAVQVQFRTVDVPEMVKSTVGVWAVAVAGRSDQPAEHRASAA